MKKYFLPIILTFTFLHVAVQTEQNQKKVTKSKPAASIEKNTPISCEHSNFAQKRHKLSKYAVLKRIFYTMLAMIFLGVFIVINVIKVRNAMNRVGANLEADQNIDFQYLINLVNNEEDEIPNSPIENFHIESHEQGVLLYADSQDKEAILNHLSDTLKNNDNILRTCNLCQEERSAKYLLKLKHHYKRYHDDTSETNCPGTIDGYCVKCLSDTSTLDGLINSTKICGCSGGKFPFLLGDHRLDKESARKLISDFCTGQIGKNLLEEYDEKYSDDQSAESDSESVKTCLLM